MDNNNQDGQQEPQEPFDVQELSNDTLLGLLFGFVANDTTKIHDRGEGNGGSIDMTEPIFRSFSIIMFEVLRRAKFNRELRRQRGFN